ncbi:MAG: hypothetical protein IJI57_03350 [Flexilinea sp.]|nr:hypothetical protein [Flexilinea sp.]
MIQGIIMPHPPIARELIGRGEEKKIQNTLSAYRTKSEKIAAYAPETIVIISPHNIFFRDAFYVSPGGTYTNGIPSRLLPKVMLRDMRGVPYAIIPFGSQEQNTLPGRNQQRWR